MQGSDKQRFSTMIEPHLDALFRAAYRLTRNRPDAEDLVQDACVRAYERLGALQEDRPVKSWLLRVMHNLFVDGARRARISPVAALGDRMDTVSAAVCSAPTPEESLDRSQRMAQLENAWSRLDRGHRALLALRAEGYSTAEIAAIVGISPDAVGMRLNRARQNLTRCLQQVRRASSPTRLEAIK
jgi:RNA polymerase sigma-70 factor (ECF subfamily)